MAATQRVRRKHNKVRTGCLTCKIRRKKCGEERPACARCTETGRQCDGYPVETGKLGVLSNDGSRSYLCTFNAASMSEKIPVPEPFISSVRRVAQPYANDGTGRTVQLEAIFDALTAYEPMKSHEIHVNEPDDENFFQYQATVTDSNGEPMTEQENDSGYVSSCSVDTPSTQAELVSSLFRNPNALAELSSISDLESHCVSYFRHCTVPRLATYFERTIWRTDLVRGALSIGHPLLFYVVTALGAVHQRFSLGISREAFEYCAHADKMYKRAVREVTLMKQSLREQTGHSSRSAGNAGVSTENLIATSEILLGLFQAFQAEYSASSAHLATGVKYAIGTPLQIVHSEGRYCKVPAKPRIICEMVYSLYCATTQLFSTPIRYHGYNPFQNPTLRTVPQVFADLEQMRDYLFTIFEEIWQDLPEGWEHPELRWEVLRAHQDRLLDWTSSVHRSLARWVDLRSTWERQAFNLLHLTRSLAHLVIYTNANPAAYGETLAMPHLLVFPVENQAEDLSGPALVVADAVERYRAQRPQVNIAGLKLAIEDVMRRYEIFHFGKQTTSSCSSSIIRRYGRTDIDVEGQQKPIVREVTEMLGLFTIARRLSEIEEMAAVELIKGILPPDADIKYVDIARILLDARKMCVRYYAPHPSGEGFVWQRESWTF